MIKKYLEKLYSQLVNLKQEQNSNFALFGIEYEKTLQSVRNEYIISLVELKIKIIESIFCCNRRNAK